jgi:hypothetical protein
VELEGSWLEASLERRFHGNALTCNQPGYSFRSLLVGGQLAPIRALCVAGYAAYIHLSTIRPGLMPWRPNHPDP